MGGVITPGQDTRARDEPRLNPAPDLTSPPPFAGPPGPDPTRDASARRLEALSTEISAPLPGSIALPTGPAQGLWRVGAALKHYEIIRKLGQGGMGSVFLARDTKLGRLVAIKVLLNHTGESAARFLAEARATASCKHDNIVVIHEVDEIQGAPYMVLEYLEGQTLRASMRSRKPPGPGELPADSSAPPGPMAPSLAVELMIPVVRALACAHQIGIVHRDLKPENILLTDAGVIKVLDFGIAKSLEVGQISTIVPPAMSTKDDSGLTRDGALIGTLPYMSPEQWLSEEIDPRTDLWAVGIMLYELCTGKHPVEPLTTYWLAQVGDLDLPMPSVRERRPDIGALGAVIDHCLKKPRADRIRSAEALLAALEPLRPGKQATSRSEDQSPFTGLSAFQEADAERFFGRESDVAGLLALLRNQPLVTVAGPSGAGKSSIVRAGVIPALKHSSDPWEAFVLRPGRKPLAALAEVVAQLQEAHEGAPDAGDPDETAARLRAQPGLLGARLRARCRRQPGQQGILIFVDQLEELYTLGAPPADRAAFIACLEGVADDASSPLRVILSIRSDFLHRIADDRHFMAEVTRGLVFLSPLGRERLREALTRPIEAAGHRFESETMIEGMLDALDLTQSPLPLLQSTAAKLWDARDRDHLLLTQRSYDTLGGVAGALSTHADAVLAGLSPVDQQLCRAVFLRLCTPERTCAVVSLSELRALAEEGSAVEQVIHHLSDARLLLVEMGVEREGTTVELAHESLIERWAKLKQWLDEDQQDARFLARLRPAAQQWEASDEADGLLWRDRAAEEASAWLARRRAEPGAGSRVGLGKREERYLLSVVALSERARRRRQWIATAAFATLGVIAAVVSLLAIRANREAIHAAAEAIEARDATRMATAREQHGDPTTALALLREVERPRGPRGWSDLTLGALQSEVARVVLIHPEAVTSAAFSPDGQRIVTASFDMLVRIWRADGTGEPLILRGHEGAVWSAAFSPDGRSIVTASFDKTARVWAADGTGEPVILRGHDGRVRSAAFSPDGKRIVTASFDRTVRVWNADGSGDPVVLRGHQDEINSVAFSPDGQRVVSASFDKTARVWSADGIGQPLVLGGHEGRVTAAAFSPDGKRIVTASEDRTARVWSADGAGQPVILRGHEGGLGWAAWSRDGQRIVTGSNDKTARVWNADGTGEPLVLRGHEADLTTAAFSPAGERIVTASFDQTVRVWQPDVTRGRLIFRGHQGYVSLAAWSPDGQRIVTASEDRTARVWRADGTGEPLILRGHDGRIRTAAWSPDGQRIVTASRDNTARIWTIDGSREPLIFRGHADMVLSAEFSPDGESIVTASEDRTVRVWKADGTGEPLVLRGHEGTVYWAGFSPDGQRVVSASEDRTARVWRADGTGEPLVLRGGRGEGELFSAVFSPDGQRIVTASEDKTARVWNADGTGEPLVLRGHKGRVYSAAFSPDGQRIVTASEDQTVRVWRADGTGEPLILRGHEDRVYSAAFSPDGRRLVTASRDKLARVWTDLTPLLDADDPKLWTATTYCLTVERRIELLKVSEAVARANQQACQRRVQAARAAVTEPRGEP